MQKQFYIRCWVIQRYQNRRQQVEVGCRRTEDDRQAHNGRNLPEPGRHPGVAVYAEFINVSSKMFA